MTIINETLGVYQDQLWPATEAAFLDIISLKFKNKPLKILEIGTWFGEGSTTRIIQKAPFGSCLILVDMWREYISSKDLLVGPAEYINMNKAMQEAYFSSMDRVKQAYSTRPDLNVSILRGASADILPLFAEKSFDFIYIDGSHYYKDVFHDLMHAKRIIKPDGLICGDDLDLEPTPKLLELAKKNLDLDFIHGEDGDFFHPGVMLAVHEIFADKVSRNTNKWWVVPEKGLSMIGTPLPVSRKGLARLFDFLR